MSATNQSGALGARRDEYDYSFEGWLLHEDRDVASPDAESTTFSYDPAGNRLTRARTAAASSDLTTYTYAGGNRLVSIQRDAVPAASLVWNGLGEVTEMADGTTIDRYPDGSELAVVGATATADITRDAFSRPAVIDDGGTTPTMQVWGNPRANLPLAGIDADGLLFANLAVEGILVGELHGATLTVAATDGHGDLILTGNTELMERPGAFGDAANLPGTSENRYRWGGQAQLAGTRLSLAQHRLYDADAGLWLSADPIGLAGGNHRFAFVGNSPLMGVDPSGYAAIPNYGPGTVEFDRHMSDRNKEQLGWDSIMAGHEEQNAADAEARQARKSAGWGDHVTGGLTEIASAEMDASEASILDSKTAVAYVGSDCYRGEPEGKWGDNQNKQTATDAGDPSTFSGSGAEAPAAVDPAAERREARAAARQARQDGRAAARQTRQDALDGPEMAAVPTDAPDLSENVYWRDARGRDKPFPQTVSFGGVGLVLDRNANKQTGPYEDGPYKGEQLEVGRGLYTRTGSDQASKLLVGELLTDDPTGHRTGPAGHVHLSDTQIDVDQAETGGRFDGMSHRHPDNITTDPDTGAATGGSPNNRDWSELLIWGGDSVNTMSLLPGAGEPQWPGPRDDLAWITRRPDRGLTDFPPLTTTRLTAPQLAFVVDVIFGSDGVVYRGTSFQVMQVVTPDPAGLNAVDLVGLEEWNAQH